MSRSAARSGGARGYGRRLACALVLALAGVHAGGLACGGEPSGSMTPLPAPPPPAALDDDALASRYAELKRGFDADPEHFGGAAGSKEFTEITSELRKLGAQAHDVHLQANAALLLGAMHQERGHAAEAAGAYRRATELVGDDAGPHMALARALLQTQDYAAAEAAQRRAIELDPDNLEQYLALGEILVKAGKQDASAKAYADYEVRRAGLIDGLTLRRDGAYIVGTQERVACAQALASASDVGTAFALLYALQSEPDAAVRAAIATTMGIHRLAGYKPRLTTVLAAETSPEVREAIAWALGEIDRDPVDTKLDGPPPAGTPGTAAPGKPAGDAKPAPDGPPVPAGDAKPASRGGEGGGGDAARGTDPVPAPAPAPARDRLPMPLPMPLPIRGAKHRSRPSPRRCPPARPLRYASST
ncbi:MAG: HEAT repeat domain-containing protein [Deltaproteobacteria bacterium]|nr:HEAT repeat domain-containing protein [Deltaproteobacteria bacterium]